MVGSEQALGESEKLLEEIKDLLKNEGKEGVELAQEALMEETDVQRLRKALNFTRSCMQEPTDYFRTALLSLCSKAVGGSSRVTLSVGASLVLFARAIGIHDDLIDQSRAKEGKLTAPGKLGKDVALILSDILLFKGFTLFRKTLESEVPLDRVIAVLDVIEKVWFEQSEGEVLEIQSRGETDILPQDCLKKIRMRASEMEACTRIGGILGGGLESEIKNLGRYGRMLGMASILRNELIDMLEFKTLYHRIRKESLPLPMVYALQNPGVRSELISLLSGRNLAKNLKEISRLVDKAGGMEYVAELIGKMVNEALLSIDKIKNRGVYQQLKLLTATLPIHPEEWKLIL